MNPPAVERLLYELAKEACDGVIVELGSFRGAGTVVLCRGARDGNGTTVYSVDAYQPRIGWIGEHYGPEDEIYWKTALEDAGLNATLIKKEHHEAAVEWELPIALLYWDPGIPGRFWHDWLDWSRFIVDGGAVVTKDTKQDHMGTFKMIAEIDTYWNWTLEYQKAGISVVRKTA